MSAEALAPQIAEIIVSDTLKTGGDAIMGTVLQVLNSSDGGEVVAQTLHKYIGLQNSGSVDARILRLGAQAGVLNINAGVMLRELKTQIEAYLSLDEVGKGEYRKKLGLE